MREEQEPFFRQDTCMDLRGQVVLLVRMAFNSIQYITWLPLWMKAIHSIYRSSFKHYFSNGQNYNSATGLTRFGLCMHCLKSKRKNFKSVSFCSSTYWRKVTFSCPTISGESRIGYQFFFISVCDVSEFGNDTVHLFPNKFQTICSPFL